MENWINSRLSGQIAFIAEIDKLKGVLRQSLIMDGSRRENTAEHSWHIAVFAMLMHEYTTEPRPDLNRVIRMLLLHDIVEVDAGDTFAYDAVGYEDKEEREHAAARRIFGLLPEDQRQEWIGAWREFEAGETAEARFANAVDRLLPLVHNYYTGGASWVRNGIVRSQVIRRIAPVETICPPLWRFAMELLDKAVDKGILLEDGAGKRV
ncbi:HD domain-containing protein [Cohnella sp. CFH 77786]|uniref:HD domain-containing protein n=1 Tax=Cohnella sp. CFH 77786 TaxID=2662265 RepID=UPI001C6086A9|nr:HD domain-containing protein [Cohnella sp. CFH 77786]MBW5448078.1 HD domain-containing protein [Cohnella sp. CFH 77786]